MITTVLVVILLSILIRIYMKWNETRNYWAKRNVPYIPPSPIKGSLTFLQKKNTAEWLREMYDQFRPSPYNGIWLFWRPALVINDPDIARRILVKDADNFRDRFLSSGETDPIGYLNIFTANDPLWSWVRRRITPMFTSAKLRHFQELFSVKTNQLMQRVDKDMKSGKKIDIRNIYTDYTTDVIGIVSFGVESDSLVTGDSAMRRVTKDFQTYSTMRGLAWACIFFFPSLVDFFRFTLFPKAATDYFTRIFGTVIKQRGGYDAEPGNNDLVDLLIKTRQDALKEGRKDISEDLLVSQAAVMIQAGFETTSSALTFLTMELAHLPDVQEKLFGELKELKEKFGELDTTVLSEAPYLNAVIKESLRKYPAMGWLDRVAATDYVIDDKLTIPAGTPVYVNAAGMHMDPDYFPNPHEFNPDRFLPENEKDIKPFTYLPFGEGPRNCIGRRFAYVSMRAALSALTLKYKLRPLPNSPKPNEIQFEKNGLFLMPGEFLSVNCIPRN